MDSCSAFLVDPHEALRIGVTQVLEKSSIDVVGSVSTLEEMMDTWKPNTDTAIVMELNLGAAEGVRPVEQTIAWFTDARIVVYAAYGPLPTVAWAYQAGAKAFVGKAMPLTLLIEAIRWVTGDCARAFFAPGKGDEIAGYYADRKKTPNPKDVLTERDFDFFVSWARGESSVLIAEKHGLDPRTVENRLSGIKQAMGIERQMFTLIGRQFNLVD